jgi:hypothetical protein
MEAEVGWVVAISQGSGQTPESKRGKEMNLPRASVANTNLFVSGFNIWASRIRRTNFSCFNPPRLQ